MINLVSLGQKQGSEKRRNRQIKRIMLMLAFACIWCSNSILTFAATANYGEKIGKWILNQFFWIFVAIVLILVGVTAVKRAYAGAVIILIVGCAIGYLMKNPSKLETIGNSIGSAFGF